VRAAALLPTKEVVSRGDLRVTGELCLAPTDLSLCKSPDPTVIPLQCHPAATLLGVVHCLTGRSAHVCELELKGYQLLAIAVFILAKYVEKLLQT
jgi:hypothetical protein